ncbi:hypothetical protein B0H65DRAFT_579734 [Neurospora tetraspora]|uniref:Uncharacterized protein n=1 Tax=Neurospora tetraspora TaxID=94610 RepID=A0AAE0J8E2_9PEZI|nr:hypothetical protein B0H65DRAFT_579734 [Neurospora tetraspora]
MSDDDRVNGNPVQKAMEAVVEAWESALNKIRECKQEYQAQLEELAGLGGMPTRAQAFGILRSFYERVNGLRNTLNQPVPDEALLQVEAPATSALRALVTPVRRKRLTKLVLPESQVVASPSASYDLQSEDVNNRKNKGKDKAIDTSTTTTTTLTKSTGSNKSGSGSITSKKDIKGKGKASPKSLSPLPFSAKTLNKITKTVNNRKTSRLPLIKPVSTLKLGSVAAIKSVPGPSRSDQRPATPEPELESDSDSESVYLSVLQFHSSLSSPPDASSTPGPSSTIAAVATAGASNSPSSNDTQEQSIAITDKGEQKAEVLACDPTTTTTQASNSASASGSGSGSSTTTSNSIQETQGIDIQEAQGGGTKEGKGKENVNNSDTPTKTIIAIGSGFIPSKKDLKGKGKAVSRSPSPGLSSLKSTSNKVTKSSKNNKENKPFSRQSPSAGDPFDLGSNSESNNIQEEIVVKDKGKGKAIASPTPTPTTTEDVNDKDEVIVITTATAASITAKASNSNNVNDKPSNSSNSTSTSSSTSGPGTIPNKKDPKEKGKAITTSPSRSAFPGPSSPKTKTTNNTDKANITKVTKRPAAAQERQTIKRSLAKKGQHWAFKLEAHFAGMTSEQIQEMEMQNKYFILCCPAPTCPSPNFGGKHPFREGRAVQHFTSRRNEEEGAGSCMMEIDGEDVDVDADDGDVEMTEAEIFERFGAEIVPEQKRWPVDDKWARKNNRELCMKVAAEGEERELELSD